MKHGYLDDKTIAVSCTSTLRRLIELNDAGVEIEFPKELRQSLYDALLDESLKFRTVSTIRQVKQELYVRRLHFS